MTDHTTPLAIAARALRKKLAGASLGPFTPPGIKESIPDLVAVLDGVAALSESHQDMERRMRALYELAGCGLVPGPKLEAALRRREQFEMEAG